MDKTIIQPYIDALASETNRLEGYTVRGIQAIYLPAKEGDMRVARKNSLTTAGIWFFVLGVIAFIVGLFTLFAIVVCGCAAMLAGAYIYYHGRMNIDRDAVSGLCDDVYRDISGVAANVTGEWKSFMTKQNDALKRQVIEAAGTDADAKVSDIDRIEGTPEVQIDLQQIRSELDTIGQTGGPATLRAYLATATSRISDAIKAVVARQQSIYSSLMAPAAAAPAAAAVKA